MLVRSFASLLMPPPSKVTPMATWMTRKRWRREALIFPKPQPSRRKHENWSRRPLLRQRMAPTTSGAQVLLRHCHPPMGCHRRAMACLHLATPCLRRATPCLRQDMLCLRRAMATCHGLPAPGVFLPGATLARFLIPIPTRMTRIGHGSESLQRNEDEKRQRSQELLRK